MGPLLVFHPLLRKAWNLIFCRSYSPAGRRPSRRPTPENASARLDQRISYDFAFAIIFLFVLHGFSAFKVLLILWINYQLCMNHKREYVPVVTWAFNVGILFANELCDGYPYEKMALLVSPSVPEANTSAEATFLVAWGNWLDRHGGIMPRWHILFNITILRLISFNLDYYWSLNHRDSSPVEVLALLRLLVRANTRRAYLTLSEETARPGQCLRAGPRSHSRLLR